MKNYDSYIRLKYDSSITAAQDWMARYGMCFNPASGTDAFCEMEAINRWYALEHPDSAGGES